MLKKHAQQCLLLLTFVVFAFTANATTYYISNDGNDSNSGTDASSPWQTINRLNSASLSPGDNVLFRRGDTFYGSIVASNSGRDGNPITYGAYGSGNKPVITGFTSVTSWTNKGGNIWESTNPVSTLSSLKIVVINGVNTPMGRYPNASTSYPFLPNFINFQSHSGTGSGNTSITSSNLSGGNNWTGADVVVRVNSWTYDRETITSQYGNTLNYVGKAQSSDVPLSDGWGFFIQNDIRTLDVQNEWYYNPSTKKISIYSIGMPVNVQVSSVETLFSLYSNIPSLNSTNVDNLNFQGANTNGVWISGHLTFSVTNCNISYTGVEGMLLYGGGIQSGVINNNNFSNCGSSSIFTTGDLSNFIIKNNVAVGSGVISAYKANDYTSGGMVISAPNSIVQYNTVDSSAYCGIQFSGNNIEIRNNFINHSNMIRDDGGGIYTGFKNESGKIIDGNIVLNSLGSANGGGPGTQPAAYGIFVDGFGTNVSITNNTVANCTSAGINLHDAQNITVNNNTVYNNGTPGNWANGNFFVQADADQFTGYVRNNSVTNNIFFAKSTGQSSLNYYAASNGDNNATSFGTFDYNYYAKPINSSTAMTSAQNISNGNMSLSAWQSLIGGDANSKESPKSVTDVNDLRFEYNATNQSKTISLDANYIDVKGNNYNGSITLAPYSSAVLIKNGAATRNQPPTANAGSDQTITLPSNTVSLSGSGADADGTIVSYHWSKLSGPSGDAISNSNSASTSVTGLLQGTYQYVLQVTDNGSASGSDTVRIQVNAAVQNATPTVYAGSDQSITLPTNTGSLNGSGSVAGGTISSYKWSQISGPSSGNIADANSPSTSVTDLVQGVYVFQLKVTDNNNNTNTSNVQITVNSTNALLPAVNPSNTVNGISYHYFEANNYTTVPDFTTVTAVKTGNVNNFDISVANRPQQFAINYTGYINVPTDGQYTFYTSSDDGSNLYIDGVQVVNNDGPHGLQEHLGTIGLQAGLHAISVGYFNQTGDKGLQVSYSGPGISQQVIPSSALFIVSNGLLPAVNPSNITNGIDYKYYEADHFYVVPDFTAINPSKTGNVNNFDISVANRPQQFAINYTGYINVPVDGQYTFYTSSDDGSNLYLDGVQVVNNDGTHIMTQQSGSIGLQAGLHAISVGYFNQTGDQGLQIRYSGPGISQQLIPSSALYRIAPQSRKSNLATSTATGTATATEVNNNKDSVTTALQNSDLQLAVSAYPNPFANSIIVSVSGGAGTYELVLVDALGRTIWRRSGTKDAGTYQQTINTSSLERGIYFLKVVQDNNSSVVKLVK
jgi:hypothetical protein